MKFNAIVIFFWILFGLAVAQPQTHIDVQLSKVWKRDLGWEVSCSWKLVPNDRLQSVRLYNNDRQFLIYRPEIYGKEQSQFFRRIEDSLQVHCAVPAINGTNGECVLMIELYQPQKEKYNYSCEVSGERPRFLMTKKDIVINAFVPPNGAVIESSYNKEQSDRVALNCTSSGMPPPSLVWTVDNLKVPHDFTDSYWNVTSKLWHVWSQMSYTPSDEHPTAVCTPEVSEGGQLEKGEPAEYLYNTANGIIDITKIYPVLITLLLR